MSVIATTISIVVVGDVAVDDIIVTGQFYYFSLFLLLSSTSILVHIQREYI